MAGASPRTARKTMPRSVVAVKRELTALIARYMTDARRLAKTRSDRDRWRLSMDLRFIQGARQGMEWALRQNAARPMNCLPRPQGGPR